MNSDCLNYLSPIDLSSDSFPVNSIGKSTVFYSKSGSCPKYDDCNIAIVGIPDSRASKNNQSCADAPDIIRLFFYPLFNHNNNLKLFDAGNIKKGNNITDTYYAAKEVIHSLLADKLFVIILGGGNDMVLANYLAYEKLNQLVNLTCIDSRFDISEDESDNSSTSYINKIIMHQPNYLFDFTNIGFQSYYVDKRAIELLSSLFFESYRLGVAREHISDVEPSIRNSNLISLDLSSIKSSDAPGNSFSSPNGFTGDEICVISRYIGCSDKISSFGIYEYSPSLDIEFRTAKLIGQILWYFLDGFSERNNELPYRDINKFIKYYVNSAVFKHEVVFYKSKQTNRWWMEVECPDKLKEKYAPQYLVPCSYNDYLSACHNEIPERWAQVYKKLME